MLEIKERNNVKNTFLAVLPPEHRYLLRNIRYLCSNCWTDYEEEVREAESHGERRECTFISDLDICSLLAQTSTLFNGTFLDTRELACETLRSHYST